MPDKTVRRVPKSVWLFTLLWFALNWFQANGTELIGDEAYYWYYSLDLSWAYFDHPPMIALFIYLGRQLLPGALGVRLLTVLSGALCIPLLWLLLDERKPDRRKIGLFIGIVSSVVLFHALGFIATPDSPLLIFSLLFYLAYRRFIERAGWWPVVWLGLSMALLLYSKYQGVLVIGFVLLSNPPMCLNRRFFFSALLALIFCLPHIAAGVQIGFPSITYQIIGRARLHAYRWEYFWTYLTSPFLILGPFMAVPLFWAGFRYRRRNAMDAAMQFVFLGVFSFFLWVSLQRRVEAHWTAPILIPAMYLGYRFLRTRNRRAKWIYRLSIPTVVLLLVARLVLAADFLPIDLEFYGRKTWIAAVNHISKKLPVIFENTYSHAAKYRFYSGEMAYSFDSDSYRKSQYDLRDDEGQFWGQKVFYIVTDSSAAALRKGYAPFQIDRKKQRWYYKVYPNFYSAQKLEIRLDSVPTTFEAGREITLQARIYNPYDHVVYFNRNAMPISLSAFWLNRGVYKAQRWDHRRIRRKVKIAPPITQMTGHSEIEVQIQFKALEKKGNYLLCFPFQFGDIPGGFNSKRYKIRIK